MRTDNKKLAPVILPIIRKIYPQMIAKDIVGIQPMQGSTGSVFSMNVDDSLINPWSKWRKTTSLWPRKSISGKWIFGFINKRGRGVWSSDGSMFGRSTRKREFATSKELFTARLKGEE